MPISLARVLGHNAARAVLIIPIGHDKAIYDRPWFTIGVIGVCVAVQLLSTLMFMAGMTGEVGELHPHDPVMWLAYRPAELISIGLLTHPFAHGGYLHLLGNMIFLWLTGANMEYRWGRWVWAGVYMTGGVVAALTFATLHPGTSVPLVGASGAIAAAMGAFLVCLYRARIKFWYFYFIMFRMGTGTFVAPAYVALPIWFAGELLQSLYESGQGGVAYSAHVGGFVFGFTVALILRLSGLEARLRAKIGSDHFDDEQALIAQGMSIPPVAAAGHSKGLSTYPPPAALPTAWSAYPPPPALPIADPALRKPYRPAAEALTQQPPPPTAPSLVVEPIASTDSGAEPPALGPLAPLFRTRDAAAMRTTGSLYIEQLAQTHGRQPQQVADIVERILRHFGKPIPLDDRALAIAVRFAARAKHSQVALAATRALIEQYPRSRYTAGAMLEAAEVQRRERMPDKAERTLQNLISAYPKSSAAKRARERLGRL